MMFESGNAHSVPSHPPLDRYNLFSIDDRPGFSQGPGKQNEFQAPQFLSKVDDTDSLIPSAQGRMKGVGLMRSQSFPPVRWYKTTRKCTLEVSKTTSNSAKNKPFLTRRSMEHEELVYPRTSIPTLEPMDASHRCTSPTVTEEVDKQEPQTVVHLEKQEQGTFVRVTPEETHDNCLGKEPAFSFNKGDNVRSESSCLVPNSSASPRTGAHSVLMVPEVTVQVAEQCIPASTCPPSAKVLVCGRRREMEDTACIAPSFLALHCEGQSLKDQVHPENTAILDWHYFGVFDGHGGSEASIYCMDRFHHLVAEEYVKVFGSGASNNELLAWTEVLKTAFSKMDKEVGGVCPNAVADGGCHCCENAIAPENVGTTAVMALVSVHQILVANCGDSRAVLARGGQAIPLSRDHKPEVEDETRRIEAAGGRIICWDGYRVGGLLALSRAIGDRYLKRYVISEPEITCTQRTEDDDCLILASDGLWDILGNDFACEVARRSLNTFRKKYELRTFPPGEDPVAATVAALLVKLAYGRGSRDNISVVIVDLKAQNRSARAN